MEYEEPIRDMILDAAPDRFGFEDITGLPWTEIDFAEDVAMKRAIALLPELRDCIVTARQLERPAADRDPDAAERGDGPRRLRGRRDALLRCAW